MGTGFILLHRKFRDNPIYSNSKAVHVWVECLMRATHGGKDFFLKRQKISLKAGQFAMGRDEFGKVIGMSGSTAWWWLTQFEKDKMVDIKKTAKGSIVTIKNWNQYQKVDNKKTTDKQQKNTNNNVNKGNNVTAVKKENLKKKKKCGQCDERHGRHKSYCQLNNL